jgi:hypothetical protein
VAETQTEKKPAAKKTWRAPKGNGKKTCSQEGCKRPYRAKGLCFFHYDKWTDGKLPHGRYNTCSKEECLKKVSKGGLCEKHYEESKAKKAA